MPPVIEFPEAGDECSKPVSAGCHAVNTAVLAADISQFRRGE